MAGLNDDIDEGLDTYLEPDNENPEAPKPPHLTIQNRTGKAVKADNDPNNVKPSDLFGGPIVPGELPNFDADFIIVTDTKNRISDNRALKTAINSSCSVCKEDALVTNEIVPGFINEKRPIGYFTDKKSKVQLNETLNALDTQLEVDVEKLREAITANTTSMIERFKASFKTMDEGISNMLAKYQPVLAKLILLVDGKPEDKSELEQFITELSKTRSHGFEDTAVSYPQLAASITAMQLPSFWRNLMLVTSTATRTKDNSTVFNIDGVDYLTQDSEPFLNEFDGEIEYSQESLIKVLYNGLDAYSIGYFKNLCQVANNTTNALGESLTLVSQLNQKEELNIKDKLDFLTQIASVNNKYARQNIAILSFTRNYFDVLDNLFESIVRIGGTTSTPVINLSE